MLNTFPGVVNIIVKRKQTNKRNACCHTMRVKLQDRKEHNMVMQLKKSCVA